jgi:hypothetical protein
MSGFEPMFMAEAFAAEAGTAALAGEVLGAEAALGGLGALEGAGAMGALGGLGAAEGIAGLSGLFGPVGAEAISAVAPEALAASQSAIAPALEGLTVPQVDFMTGADSFAKGMLDPGQISAQYTSGIPTAGPATQLAEAPITQSGLQSVYDAIPKTPTQEILSQAPIDPSTTLPAGTPYTQPGLPGAMTGTPTPLPSQLTQQPGMLDKALDWVKDNKMTSLSLGMNAMKLLGGKGGSGSGKDDEEYKGPLSKFKYDPSRYTAGTVTPPTPYTPVYKDYRMAGGGVVELMSNQNAIGVNTGYPMADISKGAYATPYQQPISRNVISDASDTGVNPMTGEMTFAGGGGIADLGAYSDGGRMLKGPGDGMSDNIPATIAGKQPARLANEEFVIPADVVSHLGNGSSDAGAKQLYKMMDRVRQARTGKKKQGKQINPAKLMPA